MRVVVFVAETVLLIVGVMAIAHIVSAKCNRPLLSLSEVEGQSLQPTLNPGERILCVRAPWHQGNIVLADVGEEGVIVKRVAGRWHGWVRLIGDNQQTSCNYWVHPKQIKSVMLCRLTLPS